MLPGSVRLANAWDVETYQLDVDIDLESWSYTATEGILLRRNHNKVLTADANTMTLHASSDLDIHSISGATVQSRDVKDHVVFALPPSTSQEEEYRFVISFKGSIGEELRGFYRVTYEDPSGKLCRMASTHFEPVGARKFFFCVDEPAARSNFSLTVSLAAQASDFTVLSNGPEVSRTTQPDGRVLHTFEQVPLIPPYLCALVVGELEFTQAADTSIPLRIYTTKGKQPRAQFALQAAAFSLDYFQTFFDCPYPLPKLDLVAVPDFPIGGMENWGCICLVESCLVDTATSSLKAKKVVSDLVCHEVSHNWFGNLVGIDWWEGLWLKEGFASWCGYFGTSLWKPDWHAMDDAVAEVLSALHVDAHQGTHPVEVPISDPSYITQVFDSISYCKGMAVVLMLQSFLGFDAFRDGIRAYIKRYQYQNTRTDELWAVLEEVSKKPVRAVMSSFTTQCGYPLITVQETDNNAESLTITQRRYALAASLGAVDNNQWVVPLTARWGLAPNAPTTSISLEHLQQSVHREDGLVKLNPLHFGFYRCMYAPALFDSILKSFPRLPYQDRRGFVSDSFAALQALPSNETLQQTLALIDVVVANERHPAVLDVLYNEVHSLADCLAAISKDIATMLLEAACGEALQQAMSWVRRAPSELSPTEAQQRSQCIGEALRLLRHRSDGSAELVQWALSKANAYLALGENPSAGSDDPDVLLDALMCAATLGELGPTRDAMEKKLEAIKDNASGARVLLRAMCMLPDADFVEGLGVRCASGTSNVVRSQYGAIVFVGLSSNPIMEQGSRVWSYFQEHFDIIVKQWGDGQFRIQSIVESVGATLSTEAAASEFEDFFATHPIPNATLSCQRAAEGIRQRAFLNKTIGTLAEGSLRKRQ